MYTQKINGKRKMVTAVSVVLLVFAFVVAVFPAISTTQAATDGWTLVTDARAMKAYPDLREYVWQKTPATPPNGQYDKIALHRLVKTGTTPKSVVFICPRVAWSGEAWISNSPTDNYTKTENISQPIYWANRGFDVYAIDYRTHFVPGTLNNSLLAFMQNWTYTLWVSDVKEAVEKTKEISGANKIFMAGPSNGGGVTMMYATKYWKDDLNGIILLDALIYNGRTQIVAKNTTGTNTYNLTKTVNDMISAATWSTPSFTAQQINRAKYALANPGAPAEDPPGTPLAPTINPLTNKTWTNITEWFAYTVQTAGAGNVYESYSNVTEYLIHTLAAEPFTSTRMSLEGQALADWTNCPYVPYDFDDHFNEINVPLLAFASGPLYSNKTGTFRFVNGLATSDFTGIMLPKYGHTDVYMGTNSARDVSQPALDWMVTHSTAGWTLTTDARSLKAYPALQETIWQKTAAMPPNGQYDKIGLHRLVKPGVTPKGVVFFTGCPMWGMGEQRISNPTTDNWTKTENYSSPIYWANRGYDVYAIDYRTNFVPKTLNASQMGFMANWGWDVWVSDTKEAADKVKEVSGASKFFIAGECSGGEAALNYAAKYWKTDLRGIILIDAIYPGVNGYPIVGKGVETNTFNMTTAIANMNAAGTFAADQFRTLRPVAAYALQNPAAPAAYPPGTPLTPPVNPVTNKTWANVTEWFTFMVQNNFGSTTMPPNSFSNLAGGYGDISQVENCFANNQFIPSRLSIENMAMTDWANCPYLTYDYNEYYSQIGVPILAYQGPYSNQTGNLKFTLGVDTTDFKANYMPKYGHMDFFFGTYSARDISQPAMDWMLSRYQPPAASAFSSATVMTGQTWYFFAHSSGSVGPNTYQWYEGTTLLTGQTSMLLPVTKTTAGTYTYICKITDAEGATATSNPVTLTVINR